MQANLFVYKYKIEITSLTSRKVLGILRHYFSWKRERTCVATHDNNKDIIQCMEHDVQMRVNIYESDQLITNLVTCMRMLSYVYIITTCSQFLCYRTSK